MENVSQDASPSCPLVEIINGKICVIKTISQINSSESMINENTDEVSIASKESSILSLNKYAGRYKNKKFSAPPPPPEKYVIAKSRPALRFVSES